MALVLGSPRADVEAGEAVELKHGRGVGQHGLGGGWHLNVVLRGPVGVLLLLAVLLFLVEAEALEVVQRQVHGVGDDVVGDEVLHAARVLGPHFASGDKDDVVEVRGVDDELTHALSLDGHDEGALGAGHEAVDLRDDSGDRQAANLSHHVDGAIQEVDGGEHVFGKALHDEVSFVVRPSAASCRYNKPYLSARQ